jgi:phosphoribosylanthranilate isomerase
MTQVKFCGFVRPGDVAYAVELGVSQIGLVFYAKSPRALDLATALALRQLIPSTVEAVGLFVNETAQNIAALAKQVKLDRLQLHGDETPAQCAQAARLTGLPWWRAIRCSSEADLIHSFKEYQGADGFLIDSYSSLYGGTGKTFDWQLLLNVQAQQPQWQAPIIMSGGLRAQNVGAAISAVRPQAVDVSSGIEAVGNPRAKDMALMTEFMTAVRSADAKFLI